MAISNRSGNQGNEITAEEFKRWLKKFDADRDGRISVEELRQAIRAAGGWWFCTRKAKRGVKMADKNLNGAIDDYEINNLVDFAQQYLGLSSDQQYA
ncbi:hypothetical protein AAHA92_23501 [Salvia divinorum]|uniref:EF-hand domain-containing protein n=1 Tax=Salvia divinorum TaxID=28513 RepID=A0ABD1GSM4_SALDI